MNSTQALLGFEQERVDAAAAAKAAAAHAKAEAKRQEEMAKNSRRWAREAKSRAKNDTLTAQCGINWYNRRRDAGLYWTHCRKCGRELIYSDDPNAKPQECTPRQR
jgi:hypothetical protein